MIDLATRGQIAGQGGVLFQDLVLTHRGTHASSARCRLREVEEGLAVQVEVLPQCRLVADWLLIRKRGIEACCTVLDLHVLVADPTPLLHVRLILGLVTGCEGEREGSHCT